MPSMVSGVRYPTSIGTNQDQRDVATKIYMQDPDAAPFTVLINMMGKKKPAINSKVEWYGDVLNPSWDAINFGAGYAAGDTSLVVDNGAYFNPSDIIKVPRTGELILVKTIVGNTLTVVVRGYGTTAAAALVDNDPLLIYSNAIDDGISTNIPALSTVPSLLYNYLQEFTFPVNVSWRLANTDLYGENDRTRLQKKAAIHAARMIDRAFLYGEPKLDVGGTDTAAKSRYLTGGLIYFIKTDGTNWFNPAGVLSQTAFDSYLRQTFTHGSTTRYLLASPILNGCISSWAGNKLQTFTEDQQFGVNITRYICPHGIVKIVEERNLAGAVYGGYGILLDMNDDDVQYRYLQNMDLKLRMDIQDKKSHQYLDEYTGTCGLMLGDPSKHGVIIGVTGPA